MQTLKKIDALNPCKLELMDIEELMKYLNTTSADGRFHLDFFEFAETVIAKKTGQPQKYYRTAVNCFKKNLKKDQMDISEISSSLMREWEEWLRNTYALTPLLEEIAGADGLVLGSPVYFGDITAQMRAFLERLAFPWLSYNDYSMTAPKKMPVILIETMNGKPMMNNSNGYGPMENCITNALGKPRHIKAYNTYQVKNYERFGLAAFSEPAKRKWREEHWKEDLHKAFDAGREIAEGKNH